MNDFLPEELLNPLNRNYNLFIKFVFLTDCIVCIVLCGYVSALYIQIYKKTEVVSIMVYQFIFQTNMEIEYIHTGLEI